MSEAERLERIAQEYGLAYQIERTVRALVFGHPRNNYADYTITLTDECPNGWSVNTTGPTLDVTCQKVLDMAAPHLK